MTRDGETYQNLLIAAAEMHYLAAEETDSETKMRMTVLALDLERMADDLKPGEAKVNGEDDATRQPDLRLVHDANRGGSD
jgi:hypothetical protein